MVVILLFVVACTIVIMYGRRCRGSTSLTASERRFAWGALIVWVFVQVWTFLPRNFHWNSALPLHVCDLTSPIATIAILRPDWRLARLMLFYWGIGLCTQAFITPDLSEGPAHIAFWAFWLPHFWVVGAAIYDVGARGFLPSWRDFSIASVLGIAYAAVMFTIDAIFGCNYGYFGRLKPDEATALDMLGPWPGRVAWMILIGIAVFAVLTWLARVAAARRHNH